jgi:hypothetical protein
MNTTTCTVCVNAAFKERLIDNIYENPDGEKFVIERIPLPQHLLFVDKIHIFARQVQTP